MSPRLIAELSGGAWPGPPGESEMEGGRWSEMVRELKPCLQPGCVIMWIIPLLLNIIEPKPFKGQFQSFCCASIDSISDNDTELMCDT